MQTRRLESMSPAGFLSLYRQDDGDIIVLVGEGDEEGNVVNRASVEFCTPIAGGGGSSRTWRALCNLMSAMAADNLDEYQNNRKPALFSDDEEQERILEWGKQLKQANIEFGDSYEYRSKN